MSGGGLRKAIGAIKDSTTVNLAKVSSDYKELDINIVKATNHVERPAKERHIRAIFAAISATRPRADVAYCIHALARRLSKTHNWAAERLSEFYEICKNLDIGRGDRFIKIEQPPSSFLQAMEEYVREAPRASSVRKNLGVDSKPKEILAIEYKKEEEVPEKPSESPPPPPEPVPEPVKVEAPVVKPPPDLLGLDDPVTDGAEFDQKNSLALAIVPVDQPASTAATSVNGTSGWELALVTAPSSTGTTTSVSKLVRL
ncbi:hypothetical protein CTI12_AA566260 [Artemisia annua]|uniref:ENTH domain-containing protein n=1 Tax=Artemisia annua TaxID=35608 RepID=A0A2U1KTI8_ARTAN|nr:hypothetical protein CTI12_AA566260 [Artemisia annua]